MRDTRFSPLTHSLKRKLSIFESSKCVHHENFCGNLRKICTFFSLVLDLEYIYMLSLDTVKLLFMSLHMTEDRKFKKSSFDLE